MKLDPGAGPPPAASNDLVLIPCEEVEASVRRYAESVAAYVALIEEQKRQIDELLAWFDRRV